MGLCGIIKGIGKSYIIYLESVVVITTYSREYQGTTFPIAALTPDDPGNV